MHVQTAVLLLPPQKAIAIVPARVTATERSQEPVAVVPVLSPWVRRVLLAIGFGLVAVFAIAAWLDPYDPEGKARRSETHLQLGLPPCTFRSMTGVPCPSCGMTTSFALLMHGDLENSLRANAVGTLLALFGLAVIPWSLASVWRKRPLFITSMERATLWIVIIFVVLLLTRWFVVVGLMWWNGGPGDF
jgi:Protein of unknown function (DUF2752)